MNRLKQIYDKIEPDGALVEQTRRKMRAAATPKRRGAWQIFKFAPALCLLAVCILIFALPESGNPAPTQAETTPGVTMYSVDPLYDEMRQNSGGKAFMKAEAYVTDADGDSYALDIVAVECSDNASLPQTRTLFASFSAVFTCSDALQSGQAYTFWLYADEQGNWNIYEFERK